MAGNSKYAKIGSAELLPSNERSDIASSATAVAGSSTSDGVATPAIPVTVQVTIEPALSDSTTGTEQPNAVVATNDLAPNAPPPTATAAAAGATASGPVPAHEQSRAIRYGAWVALIVSVLSMSAVGPTFVYVQRMGVSAILAASWRCQCMLLFLVVPAACEHWLFTPAATRWKFMQKNSPREWHVLWIMLAQASCWATSLSLWVIALQYTTTVRASLFSSTYPIWLLLWVRFGTGVKVSAGEFIGVGVCFAGVVVSMITALANNEKIDRSGGTAGTQLIGDALACLSAFIYTAQVLLAARGREKLQLFTFSVINTSLAVMWLSIGALAIEGSYFLSAQTDGIFGWVDPRRVVVMLIFGFVVGMIGLLGFNFCVKYISTIVLTAVQLSDPAITGLMAWMAGLEGVPGVSTFIGFVIVTCGIAVVIYYEDKRKKLERAIAAAAEAIAAGAGAGGTRSASASAANGDELQLTALSPITPAAGASSTDRDALITSDSDDSSSSAAISGVSGVLPSEDEKVADVR